MMISSQLPAMQPMVPKANRQTQFGVISQDRQNQVIQAFMGPILGSSDALSAVIDLLHLTKTVIAISQPDYQPSARPAGARFDDSMPNETIRRLHAANLTDRSGQPRPEIVTVINDILAGRIN